MRTLSPLLLGAWKSITKVCCSVANAIQGKIMANFTMGVRLQQRGDEYWHTCQIRPYLKTRCGKHTCPSQFKTQSGHRYVIYRDRHQTEDVRSGLFCETGLKKSLLNKLPSSSTSIYCLLYMSTRRMRPGATE